MTPRAEYWLGLLVLGAFVAVCLGIGFLGWHQTKQDWSVAGKELARDELTQLNDTSGR